MEIRINRLHSNDLYTEGRLYINDLRQTFTVESTEVMLPAGKYILKLNKKSARKRELVIYKQSGYATEWRIGICHSWIGSKKERIIGIGKPLIPGALYKAPDIYERIIKRLEKCEGRNEEIILVIHDNMCTLSMPIKHWLEPSDHGCPPTTLRVELHEEDLSVTIFNGNNEIRHLTVEDQKALINA